MKTATKTNGRITCATPTRNGELCLCTVEIQTSKGTETATYSFSAVAAGEKYEIRKHGGDIRNVNLWDNTCDCEGYANGYNCRHLRMVKALRAAKKLS